jgi:predicted ATP-grasp superfamily ATP-dependent carboligase
MTGAPAEVLVVAVSARMIAQLAVADGFGVSAVDRFGDLDLRALAPVSCAGHSDALAALAARIEARAVVYGAGFENRPDLVRRICAGRELLGTPAECLPLARDPWALAAAARAAGARAPQTSRTPPRDADGQAARTPPLHPGAPRLDGWLCKPLLGGGGRGVRRYRGGELAPGEIIQRQVWGLSCSAAAIADGHSALTLGVSEQLHRRPGFRWCGNVVPPRLPAGELDELEGQLSAVCTQAAARFGLRGAFGVDAIWDGRHAWVLELNPRPTASLELFGPSGIFTAHVSAARGRLMAPAACSPQRSLPTVKLVLYASNRLIAPDPGFWPAALTRDIPVAGQVIPRGAPVCTLVSTQLSVAALRACGARLAAALSGAPVGHG